MNVIGLDGKTYKFKLHGYSKKPMNKSKPHLEARALISNIFPQTSVLEEVRIPGTKLRLDFYIPSYGVAVEINGRQHSEYVPHFHETKMNFYKGVSRDRRKVDWCELNQISLIILEYNDRENWERLLRG